VRALVGDGARVTIDTRNAATMAAALDAGAVAVNDVSALTHDPAALPLVAARCAPVVLMHMSGDPRTMQDDPRYDDVVAEVRGHLAVRVAACVAAGVPAGAILVDPGIGFGKTVAHNCRLIRELAAFAGLGAGVLLGVSRKSLIAKLSEGEPPKARLPGSIAAALAGVAHGARVLRVHDVAATLQALRVWRQVA
jgi:dihydropteroate synthase